MRRVGAVRSGVVSGFLVRSVALIAALAAGLIVIGPANAASPRTTVCTGTISSGVIDQSLTIEGNVVVPPSANCALYNIKIDGNLTVGAGATFDFGLFAIGPFELNGVSGNVVSVRAAGLGIAFAPIGGSVTAVGDSTVGLDRTSVAKNAVFIGNNSLFVHDVSIGGALSCENNGTVTIFFLGAAHASGQCANASF